MSVYIKGMKMPTSCAFCRFCEGLADTLKGTCAFCMVDGKYRDAQTNDGCPLVPVPEHGRTIDADAADDFAYGELSISSGYRTPYEASRNMQKIYLAMPTIIPASKEKE